MTEARQPAAKRPAHKRGHGEGSIDQTPDGRWRGRLMVGYKPDGKPDRRTLYGKTRADVQRQLRELKRQVDQGGITERHNITVAEFLDQWLQDCVARGLKPKTTTNYRQMGTLYLTPAIGKVKLTTLRPEHVRKLCADLMERGLSATTVRYVRHLLHGALRLAVQMELVARNVADPVRAPKRRRQELQPPTPDDLAKLLDSADAAEDRFRALWVIGVYTGCRPGELLALKWRDVEWETSTILIRRNVTAVLGQPLALQEPKTERGQRRVPVPSEALIALKAHRQRQLEERLLLGPDYDDQDLIFATHTGGLLHPRNVTREFKEALARAGLPRTIRSYDLRHAYATMLFQAGEHPKIVSERLGHSSIALTLDTYTHYVPGLDDDTAAKVQRLIRPNTPRQPDGSPGRIGPNIGPKGTDDGSPSDVGGSSPSGSERADGQNRTDDQLFTKQLLYP